MLFLANTVVALFLHFPLQLVAANRFQLGAVEGKPQQGDNKDTSKIGKPESSRGMSAIEPDQPSTAPAAPSAAVSAKAKMRAAFNTVRLGAFLSLLGVRAP